jgi:hypothetical protein
MKTVTVSSIVANAASRAGLDGSSIGNLPSVTKSIMVDNLGSHLKDAWEFFDWPDLCRTEERTVQTGVDEDIYIDLAQAGETEIGDVFSVFQDNPNTHAAPREISFSLDLDKVRLPSDCPSVIYVRFRLTPGAEPRDPNGLVVTPVVDGVVAAQTVPQILADYCKFSLTGDLLTEDGQLDKAQVMYGRAELSLVKETEKLTLQQRQVRRWTANVGPY